MRRFHLISNILIQILAIQAQKYGLQTENSFKNSDASSLPCHNSASIIKGLETNEFDSEYPLNNINSFFPIDAIIEYPLGANETSTIISRYASFSPIIDTQVQSRYKIIPNDACSQNFNQTLNIHDYDNHIVVVKRGGCTFGDKIRNIVESGIILNGVIVGNNEPNNALITMYSSDFNLNGEIKFPILFITLEDYRLLGNMENKRLQLSIYTASLGSWLNLMISMALSPPLLIICFYLSIKLYQLLRRKQQSLINIKLVNNIPVYVFNNDHLIPLKFFKNYLMETHQTEPSDVSSQENFSLKSKGMSSSSLPLNNMVYNGVSIKDLQPKYEILICPNDYYPAYKCSICLDIFHCLKSKVLVLNCKHIYHQKCLSNWLINFRKSCPLCNTILRSKQNLLQGTNESQNYGTFDVESHESEIESSGTLPILASQNNLGLTEGSSSNIPSPHVSIQNQNQTQTHSSISSQSFYSATSNQHSSMEDNYSEQNIDLTLNTNYSTPRIGSVVSHYSDAYEHSYISVNSDSDETLDAHVV